MQERVVVLEVGEKGVRGRERGKREWSKREGGVRGREGAM
jgi:hypothetical protein